MFINKKERDKIKSLIILLVTLILVLQPVSAGFFEDALDIITGKTVEEADSVPPVEPDPVPPVEPEEPKPVPPEDSMPPRAGMCPTEIPPTCPDGKTSCPMEERDEGCPSWDCNACEEKPPLVCMPTPQFCPDGKTSCPSKKDEEGCTYYDCDACETPPEEVCPPIPTKQWCNAYTLCPKGITEKGCPTWNCNDCEVKCPPIQTTMTCGADYCEGKSLSECLCPMKTDEKGCSYWDCDSCDVCGPSPQPELCSGCGEGEHLTNEERWEKCICPKKTDENGCTVFDCDSCETTPDNCRKITLEGGAEVIECEKDCLGIPEGSIKNCEESGGKVIERTDHYGCPFIECEYDVDGECPAPEALEARKKACLNQGLEPMIVRKGECDTIKCRRAEPEPRCAEDVGVKKEIKEKCIETGGEVVKHFDNRGCPVTACIYSGEECKRDVPPEAYKNCEMEEGDLMVKRDSQGCLIFADCIKRGKREVEYEEIEEMPSVATLVAIALKLESLKIDFDKLAREVMAIAKYYEGVGDKEEAARFRKVAGLFSSALDKIEDIKIKFRENAREMTEEDLRELKYDLNYVSEVIMQDALYIILGGEIEIGGGADITIEGYTDCGSDDRCWKEALRLCEPAIHSPNRPRGDPVTTAKIDELDDGILTARIHGLDDEGVCMIDAQIDGYSMFCKVKDYATLNSDGPEILEFCEGDMVEWLRSGQKPGKIKKPKPGKCVDRCGDGICHEAVSMAKGAPCPESAGSCSADCGAMPTEFDLCTEEDEEAWQVCQNEGGLPQTDPSRYKNCEIYTHCRISPETAGECEEYTIPEIKNECYIALAEKTGDSSLCVEITRPDRKDKCYVKVATRSKEGSICEKIEDEGIKEHCYNSIAGGGYGSGVVKGPTGAEGEVVFTDDFEGGTENWIFHNEGGGDWSIVEEGGNKVLRLHGVVQPDLPKEWDNYIFKFRFKRIEGSMHVNFRKTSRREGQSRYIVAISSGVDNLNKHFNVYDDENWQRLDDTHFGFDEGWHTLEIRGYDNILSVYLDDELLYGYKDTENPFLSGIPGFEIHTGGRPIIPEFLIDDVEIRISGEKDVIGGVS